MGEHFDALTQEQQEAVSHHTEQLIQKRMHGENPGAAAFARNNTEQLRENLHEDLAQHGNLEKLVADYAAYRENINSKYNIPQNMFISHSEINDILDKKPPTGRTR